MDSVILVGGGGHAKQIIEIITAQKSYRISGITDNDPAKRKCWFPVCPFSAMIRY